MKRKRTYRRLRHGDAVPEGEPRRYITPGGYVVLRWNVAPYVSVECFEHRLTVGLPPDDVHVHHINHDKTDNRVSNLELIEPDHHAAQHHAERNEELDALAPEMVEMRESGMSYRAIAQHFDCSPASISTRVRQAMGVAKETRAPSCKRGHPYTEENTRIRNSGRRACRACERDRARARQNADAETVERLRKDGQ